MTAGGDRVPGTACLPGERRCTAPRKPPGGQVLPLPYRCQDSGTADRLCTVAQSRTTLAKLPQLRAGFAGSRCRNKTLAPDSEVWLSACSGVSADARQSPVHAPGWRRSGLPAPYRAVRSGAAAHVGHVTPTQQGSTGTRETLRVRRARAGRPRRSWEIAPGTGRWRCAPPGAPR